MPFEAVVFFLTRSPPGKSGVKDIPPLLFVRDIQGLFALKDSGSAARWMHRLARRGAPLLRLGKRLAIRREDLMAVLPQFEVSTSRRQRIPGKTKRPEK